jgi:hypothetical protein
MNTIMRSIGGAIGAQISASLLASSLSARGLASDHAFTLAFLVSGVGLLLAVAAASLIPRGGRPQEALVPGRLREAEAA